MPSKVIYLREQREAKQRKLGRSIDDIRQHAVRRAELNRTIERHEPDNLASGMDMKKILNAVDGEDE
jgi:hypothetical protein